MKCLRFTNKEAIPCEICAFNSLPVCKEALFTRSLELAKLQRDLEKKKEKKEKKMKVIRIEVIHPGYDYTINPTRFSSLGDYMLEIGLESVRRIEEIKNLELYDKPYKCFFTPLGYKKFGLKLVKKIIKSGYRITLTTRFITPESPFFLGGNEHQVLIHQHSA